MHYRNAAVIAAMVAMLSACSFMGQSAVRVETGNQPTGYLSRPLLLTASSDESVQQVAQRICDSVRPGTTARTAFVGKVPGPGPLDLASWGRYRYDCDAISAGTVPARLAPAASSAALAGDARADTAKEDLQKRECQRQQGALQVCLGSCLMGSTSAAGVVEEECRQRCAPKVPASCH
jgi:hypothetical protein